MRYQCRFITFVIGLLFWALSTGVLAAPIPPEGTCICDSFGCSKVVAGAWVHATSCPNSGSNAFYQSMGVHYANQSTSIDVTVGGRKYTLHENTAPHSSGVSFYQPPAQANEPERGWSIAAGYANTDFSANSTLAGQTRRARQFSLNAQYVRDYDEWGYLVSIPIKRMDNNGVFGALNDSSIGIAFMPSYHLLHQQVHGVKMDIGAVVGYDRHWLDNKAALLNPAGAFALTAFDDPSSWQAGAFVRMDTQLGATGLGGGISQIGVHNLTNQSLLGRNVDFTIVDMGAKRIVGEKFMLGFDLRYTHLSQVANTVDRNFGSAALSLGCTDRRKFWQVRGAQTFSNADYQTRSLQLTFGWVLD
ncbi:MAG: hypothetical protein PHH47_01295 [Gallionella sp.]|nr:hypothetical protein [Gallionella sp.]MDD4946128.1 hypothetical protein [Gallionella sp.]MDD5612399.1 hypothetical protein [Gallionella sp.]